MATWSGIRKKLESEYLAESLRGRIQYYATSYSRSPDHKGRAAIYLDGKPVIQGNYYNYYLNAGHMAEEDVKNQSCCCWNVDQTVLELGMFDQRDFYRAFNIFDNQSIEKSLKSDDFLVRIFAVLDRRVGKRTLKKMADDIENQPETVRLFIDIRLQAENMVNNSITGCLILQENSRKNFLKKFEKKY